MLKKNSLGEAIQRTLHVSGMASTALAFGCLAPLAHAQTSGQPASGSQGSGAAQPQTLSTIVVTGSHIRRVDLETSNPVVAVTAQEIAKTGKLTLGDVIQSLPVITGGIESPNVNNGGGSGSTNVGLRGLGPSRTLILVDGQRLLSNMFPGGVTAPAGAVQDLNFIPSAAVERIEVLTDGASAVYGSDAIGGVINVILKSNYQGAQFQADYGISDHDDAARQGASFMFGQTSDKGSILAGVDYNKFDPLLTSQRKFSENAISLTTSSGHVIPVVGGSSFAARDKIVIPASVAACGSGGAFSLNQSAANSGTSPTTPADYHCFTNSDKYNFASVNLILTPQERVSGFFKGIYHLTDNIDFYATYLHQKSSSAFQVAPAVFGTDVGVTISKDSYYNPFGVDFTPSNGNGFRARLFAGGNRGTHFATVKDQIITGLRGNLSLFGQDWNWDAGYNYGHFSRTSTVVGVPDQAALQKGLGPSFLDPVSGQVVCGTPGNIIPNCTPWDPFNMFNPNSQAAVAAAAVPVLSGSWDITRTYHADISGGLFDLPAGTVQLAAGADYNKQYANSTIPASLITEPYPPFSCPLGSLCTAHLQAGYSVKEAYAEMLVPVLKDMPLVRSLNITLGDRFSKYSNVGNTNNWKIGLEWKPIDDLLLRGTITTVFRAPSLGQIYGAPIASAPFLNSDPCDGFTGAPAGSGPAMACVNVPTNGTFKDPFVSAHQQLNAVTAGGNFFGIHLKPESGKTFDIGAVYSPRFLPGLSVTADLWRVYLNDTITAVAPQTSLQLCYNGVTYWCPFISQRLTGAGAGTPGFWETPTANLGRADVKGLDVSANYKFPEFSFGQLDLGLNATYLTQFKLNTAPGEPGSLVLNGAGVMGIFGSALQSSCITVGGLCFFPRIRATSTLGWQRGPWDAQWTMRYISSFKGGSADPSQLSTMVSAIPGYVINYGATVYNSLTVGYNIEPLNTRIDIGVDNMFDKQPPFLYASTSGNDNTDPQDFDAIGRFYFGRVTVKF